MRVLEAIKALGMTTAEFSRRAGGMAPKTLHKADADISSVKPETRNRIRETISEVKAERLKKLEALQSA